MPLWASLACGQQKGAGVMPTPNYYQTSERKLCHRNWLETRKQKGAGKLPTPNYYQAIVKTSVPQIRDTLS